MKKTIVIFSLVMFLSVTVVRPYAHANMAAGVSDEQSIFDFVMDEVISLGDALGLEVMPYNDNSFLVNGKNLVEFIFNGVGQIPDLWVNLIPIDLGEEFEEIISDLVMSMISIQPIKLFYKAKLLSKAVKLFDRVYPSLEVAIGNADEVEEELGCEFSCSEKARDEQCNDDLHLLLVSFAVMIASSVVLYNFPISKFEIGSLGLAGLVLSLILMGYTFRGYKEYECYNVVFRNRLKKLAAIPINWLLENIKND